MDELVGAAILFVLWTLACINAADPLLSAALLFLGVILCGFAAAGRHEGGKADPA